MNALRLFPTGEEATIEIAGTPIVASTSKAPPPAAAPGGQPGALRAALTSERNGRLGARLAPGAWEVVQSADLAADLAPSAVLATGDRVLVVAGLWQLFDRDFKPIASGPAGLSPFEVSPQRGLFFLVNGEGYFTAFSLATGAEAWAFKPKFGDEYLYPVIDLRDSHAIVLGTERQLDPHGRHKAAHSYVETISLGEPLDVSDSGHLLSAESEGVLLLPTTTLVGAIDAAGLVCAAPGRIFRSVGPAEPGPALTGEFDPMALSLDEAGRMYLVVRVGGQPRLWCIARSGQRVYSTDIPEDVALARVPPLVSHDHRVFLLAAGRLMAFSATGEFAWEFKSAAPPGGAAVSADDLLLLTAGEELIAFDREGRGRVLVRLPGERLRTSPIIDADGTILLATETRLLRLRSK